MQNIELMPQRQNLGFQPSAIKPRSKTLPIHDISFRSGGYDFEKQLWNHHCVIKQRESSNARHLVAQAIIDCAHKGIREPDEKRRCAYEDQDRLNRREA